MSFRVSEFQSFRVFTLFVILLLFAAIPSAQAQRITATVTITAATTNADTFVMDTLSSSTRTWTNSVIVPSTQILTNSTVEGVATNLQLHLQANPPAGVQAQLTAAAVVTLYGQSGIPLQISGVGDYFTVTYATQAVTAAYTVRIPNTVEADSIKTNVASQISAWIELSANTNSIDQNSTAMSELVGLTNAQTISGVKTFTGAAILLSPTIGSPTTTNLVNNGNAISSPGSGTASEQFGSGAAASGESSLAVGPATTASAANTIAIAENAVASGVAATAIGTDTTASGAGSMALGTSATATGQNSFGIGYSSSAVNSNAYAIGTSSSAAYSNSIAIGSGAATTAANQIMLGTAAMSAVVNNNLTVQSNVSVAGGAMFGGAITNILASGQMTFGAHADIAFLRYPITTLANGNNAAVAVGTNTFIEVSGPTGAFVINGIANGRDGKLLIIVNQTGQDMTIANQSGTDPTAANRIINFTGADRATTGNGAATLIYSGAASRWLLISLDP